MTSQTCQRVNVKSYNVIFTGRNEVVAKVTFLHVCMILFTWGGVSGQGEPPQAGRTPPEQQPPRSRHPPGADPPGADPPPGSRHPWSRHPPGADTPPEQTPPLDQTPPPRKHIPAYGQRAAGTHPTGMHSC